MVLLRFIISFYTIFFVPTIIFAVPVQKIGKTPKPSDLIKKDRSSAIIVPVFGLKLHLFADQKSDILRSLKFGEQVRFDENSLEAPNPDWIPVILNDGLSGFLQRRYLLFVPKSKYLNTLVFESEKQINSKSITYLQKIEITDMLFYLSQTGQFTGDDFIYLRAKAGYALKKTLDQINELKLKPDATEELLNFLKKHQSKLLFDYGANRYYVDSNYYWKLIESYPKTKHSDYAGFLAIESLPMVECKDDLKCKLEEIRKGKMRYIYFFPTGNYVKMYTKDIVANLKNLTKDPDAIACYEPVLESIKAEITMMFRYVSEYGSRERKEIIPYLQILKNECMK